MRPLAFLCIALTVLVAASSAAVSPYGTEECTHEGTRCFNCTLTEQPKTSSILEFVRAEVAKAFAEKLIDGDYDKEAYIAKRAAGRIMKSLLQRVSAFNISQPSQEYDGIGSQILGTLGLLSSSVWCVNGSFDMRVFGNNQHAAMGSVERQPVSSCVDSAARCAVCIRDDAVMLSATFAPDPLRDAVREATEADIHGLRAAAWISFSIAAITDTLICPDSLPLGFRDQTDLRRQAVQSSIRLAFHNWYSDNCKSDFAHVTAKYHAHITVDKLDDVELHDRQVKHGNTWPWYPNTGTLY